MIVMRIPEWRVMAYAFDEHGREHLLESGPFVNRDLAERCAVSMAAKSPVHSVVIALCEPGFPVDDVVPA
jgi:hypothetical protein